MLPQVQPFSARFGFGLTPLFVALLFGQDDCAARIVEAAELLGLDHDSLWREPLMSLPQDLAVLIGRRGQEALPTTFIDVAHFAVAAAAAADVAATAGPELDHGESPTESAPGTIPVGSGSEATEAGAVGRRRKVVIVAQGCCSPVRPAATPAAAELSSETDGGCSDEADAGNGILSSPPRTADEAPSAECDLKMPGTERHMPVGRRRPSPEPFGNDDVTIKWARCLAGGRRKS